MPNVVMCQVFGFHMHVIDLFSGAVSPRHGKVRSKQLCDVLRRCYYRCTYHQDHGCPATKHVEQTNSQDPPLFRVIYTNEHTCISTDASSVHIQQMADASLRKAGIMELSPSLIHSSAGHEVIKEEEGAIVSSLLGIISGGGDVATLDATYAMQENTAALLSSKYSNMSSAMGRSSHEASSSISPVLLPASDDPKMDLVDPLESQWLEPLDFGWFIESTRTG